jgi:hypothetical protein
VVLGSLKLFAKNQIAKQFFGKNSEKKNVFSIFNFKTLIIVRIYFLQITN